MRVWITSIYDAESDIITGVFSSYEAALRRWEEDKMCIKERIREHMKYYEEHKLFRQLSRARLQLALLDRDNPDDVDLWPDSTPTIRVYEVKD